MAWRRLHLGRRAAAFADEASRAGSSSLLFVGRITDDREIFDPEEPIEARRQPA